MTQNSQHSPATEVWRRFSGMFGAEALERKYGRSIPDEWTAMLSRLNEFQVQRGVRMLAYSGKGHVPSLPEFVKLCRDAEHDRELSSRPSLPAPPDGFDKWAIEGNQHFLAFILRNLRNKRTFGERETRILVARKNLWAAQMRLSETADGVPIQEQQEVWAECMRLAEAEIAAAP